MCVRKRCDPFWKQRTIDRWYRTSYLIAELWARGQVLQNGGHLKSVLFQHIGRQTQRKVLITKRHRGAVNETQFPWVHVEQYLIQ